MGNRTVPLGRYTKIKTGKLDANASSVDGAYPFFTCSREPLRISSHSYDCECVLVAGNGDLNVKYYSGKFDAYQRTYIIESTDNQKLDTRYLYYFLDKYVEKLREQSIGGVIKYIKLGYLTEAKIPIPPLEVQRKIADVLDRAGALIEKRKAQIGKLDLLVKSQFIEMFGDPVTNPKGWAIKKLGRVIEGTPQNGLYKPSTDYLSDGSGTPIVRIDAFYDGKLKDIPHFRRLNCTEKEVALYRLDNQDIVINRVNSIEYLGKCAYIEGLSEPTVFESNMMRFKVNRNELHPLFTAKLLCSPYIYDQIISHAKKAVNQASINQKDVQDFNLVIPPLTLQNEFATFVERVETQKTLFQQSLAKLELNYKSLMQKCFAGEVF